MNGKSPVSRSLSPKNLSDIRPAKGVKTRQSNERIGKPKQPSQQKSSVIQGVPYPKEDLEPPTEEAAKLVFMIREATNSLIIAMKGFNRLLNDPKLSENMSEREKQEETLIINELTRAAEEVEKLEPGKGVMSLCVFAVRLSLSLRDAGNKLAYKNHMLEERVKNLEKEAGIKPPDDKEKEKRMLLEQAEKLGIKISIKE